MKKKNTRDYGKFRQNFRGGGEVRANAAGPVYDYFGNVTTDYHINRAGGLVKGPGSTIDTDNELR